MRTYAEKISQIWVKCALTQKKRNNSFSVFSEAQCFKFFFGGGCFIKVMEGFIRDVLMEYLTANKLIRKEQHGFVPKKCCTTNLLETLDLITHSLANGNSVDEIMLDFAKAFDKVPHQRLLLKLKAYGLSDDFLAWIKSFLSNRKQRVILAESKSEWADVVSGVPQGSVLGPLLFVVYINDLPDSLMNSVKMYADDSKILAIVRDWHDKVNLQKDLDHVCEWTNTWLMSLNYEKCKIMHFGKNNEKQDYFLKDREGNLHQVSNTESERDLGVIVSKNLKWHEHIQNIASKANRILGMLKRTFESRELELWKKLYISLVRPHLEFAVQVWNPTLQTDIDTIEKVQERATRIPSTHKNLNYTERLKSWGITSLDERRKRGDVIELYKTINGIEDIDWINPPTPKALIEIPGPASSVRGHSLRINRETFNSKLRNDHAAAVSARHCFFRNRVTPLWNTLSHSLVFSTTLEKFKVEYDRLFI